MGSYTSSESTDKPAAKTLDGRLLCAAALAYEIREPYLSGAGFLSPPLQIAKGVNSCLIGRTRDGIVIAVRGTTSEASDWLQNTSAKLISTNKIPKGRVHKGFYMALYDDKGLAKEIKKALQELLKSASTTTSQYKSSRGRKMYLTGHSKGGCLASLLALELLQSPDLPNPEYVCTFGAPRMGDAVFGQYYQQHIRQTTYENHLDIIPFLPPSSKDKSKKMTSLMEDVQKDVKDGDCQTSKSCAVTNKKWEYVSIGTRKFLSHQGKIVHNVTQDLDLERIREFEAKTILRIVQFRQAHCSSCPDDKGCSGGYFKAIAPEICVSLA